MVDKDFAEEIINPEPFDCLNLPLPTSGNGWITVFPEFSALQFAFNPINSNQFVYTQYDNYGLDDSVFLFDLIGRQRVFLIPENANRPVWGPKGWVLFQNGSIYKFKSDGTGLQRLALPGICSRPLWSPSGEDFIFISSGNGTYDVFVATLESEITDTLSPFSPFDWYENDSILMTDLIPGTNQVKIYTTSISSSESVYFCDLPIGQNPMLDGIREMKMFPNHQKIAILTGNGLWIASRRFGPKQIVESCDNRRIFDIDISDDGRFIFTEEVDFVQIDSFRVNKTDRLAKRDAYTGRLIETIFESK